MFDFIIARFLYRLSDLISILEGENYRSKAFYKAALAIDGYGKNTLKLYKEGSLNKVVGIGSKIEKYIIEIIETGKLFILDEMQGKLPDTIYDIIDLPQINNHIKKKIIDNKIYDIEKLKQEVNDYQSFINKGFNDSAIKKITSSLSNYKENRSFYQFGHAYVIGNEIVNYLNGSKLVKKVSLTGSLRRREELVTSIDIILSVERENNIQSLLKKDFLLFNVKNKEAGVYQAKTYLDIPVNIYVVGDINYYGELFKLTGPKEFIEHVIKNEDDFNIIKESKSEEDTFEKLNIKYIVPELRYRYVTKKRFINTNLVTESDFLGDLHAHTNWSDGIDSLEDMMLKGKELGFKYIAVCDHSVSLKISNGMSNNQLLKQIEIIKKLNSKSRNFKILSGIEVDIKADGTLDYPDYILSQLDFVVAAIHSGFNQSKEEMMRRLKKALANQYVNILAHPTGRLLGRPGKIFNRRDELNIDFEELLDICKENKVALEINAFPERLDLNRDRVVKALQKGLKLSIGTDAHSSAHLAFYQYGLYLARSAGAKASDILNTYSYLKLKRLFHGKRNNEAVDENLYVGQKNFAYYFGNNADIMDGKKTIVGIDLTASSKKATGWSFMKRNKVITKLLVTDADIINQTIKFNPDIISIDSPLSIPAGRCCIKEACECRKYGIMRYCEKTLMRMRIGVFPCLLPSMAGLTERGMRLAKSFREKGYEVIESYPGVAQDILHIDRKKRGIERLIRGLKIFGITGDINKKNIIHDEVDAITSALVGYFYLNNQYIPLGMEAENYLIIPRIHSDILNKQIIIGIVGEHSSGKTILAEYLRFKYGFKYWHLKEAQSIPNIIKNIEEGFSYVIEGINDSLIFNGLKEYYQEKLILIYIDSHYNNRFKRYKNEIENAALESFEGLDNKDNDIFQLAFMADYRINNNKGFIDMFDNVGAVITDIFNNQHKL